MLTTVFATKLGMTQAWTKAGKRLAVTRCKVANNVVMGYPTDTIIEVGYGTKKIKNMSKPLRSRLEKGGLSLGITTSRGVKVDAESRPQIGETLKVDTILTVGDVVKVQGISKGRGFAGAVKRHGFAGGPKTHGQSDRERSVGSIGAGTTPGRVFKGKKMPGHYGVETHTVVGLVVLHIDPATQEIWLSGPVPGANTSHVRIVKTGETKQIELDVPITEAVAPEAVADTAEVAAA